MDPTPLLRALVERGASDLHCKVGSPPALRIGGQLVRGEAGDAALDAPLTAEGVALLAQALLTTDQQQALLRDGAVVATHSEPGTGRFRVAVFRQRGSVSVVVHAVPPEVRPLDDLGLPAAATTLASAERGLVLVASPVGGGATTTTRRALGIHSPMASAISDVAAARRDYMDESGGRYVHVIADGGMGASGDIVKAIAMGADAVMLGTALARAEEAPGKGWHWGQEAHHLESPRGDRVNVGTVGPLEEVLFGPGHHTNGTSNVIGALRRSMATTGYSDLKEFQRVDVVVSPYAGN